MDSLDDTVVAMIEERLEMNDGGYQTADDVGEIVSELIDGGSTEACTVDSAREIAQEAAREAVEEKIDDTVSTEVLDEALTEYVRVSDVHQIVQEHAATIANTVQYKCVELITAALRKELLEVVRDCGHEAPIRLTGHDGAAAVEVAQRSD